MKINSPKSNLWIDAGLFAFLLASFWLELTGLSFHQWLGAVLAAGVAVHLLTHWSWVKTVTRRFFGHTSGQARLFYILDTSLLLGLTLTGVTGLVISTWLGLDLTNYTFWKDLHVAGSVFALLVVVLKIGLHWRWIVKIAGRTIFTPRLSRPLPPVPQLAAVPVDTGRRDFLRLMGVVSVAALVSISNIRDSDVPSVASASVEDQMTSAASDSAEASESILNEIDPGSFTSSLGVSQSASSTSCRIECDRRCSYPGHCRRYVDRNGNNHCDRGECI